MTKKITLDIFVEKAKKFHENKYDYSQSVYNGYNKEITIICPDHGDFKQTPHKHIKGLGCPLCITKDNRTDKWIKEVSIIHNNKYDYSQSIYKSVRDKLIIICPDHGNFEQNPYNHKKGQGCPDCRDPPNKVKCNKKFDSALEKFIYKAKLIHGDKYDYSKVDYKSCKEKIEIICPIHNSYYQTPDSHINNKTGCNLCSFTSNINTENYIKIVSIIHNNKYDYSKVKYTKSRNKITIICPDHGEFEKTANAHQKGNGCSKCYGNYNPTHDEWIKEVSIIHKNKYDYSKTKFISGRNEIIIICPEHGEYTTTAREHKIGQECPRCAKRRFSKGQIQWLELIEKLENISIQHFGNSFKEYKIPTTNYHVDGYCEETNTVFSYHGDFFHGSPKVYARNFYNTLLKKTMGELYDKTINRENKIKELGYNVKVMWEYDWIKINKSIKKLQRKFRLYQCQLKINNLSLSS